MKRKEQRVHRQRSRYQNAPTAADRLAAAFDYARGRIAEAGDRADQAREQIAATLMADADRLRRTP